MKNVQGVVACAVVCILLMTTVSIAQVCLGTHELIGTLDDSTESIVARLLSGVSWAIDTVIEAPKEGSIAIQWYTVPFYVPDAGIIIRYTGPTTSQAIGLLTQNLSSTMKLVGPLVSQFFWENERLAILVGDLGYFIWNYDDLVASKEAQFHEYSDVERHVLSSLVLVADVLGRESPEDGQVFTYYAPGLGVGINLSTYAFPFPSSGVLGGWSCSQWKSYILSGLELFSYSLTTSLGQNETLTFFTRSSRMGELFFVATRNTLTDPENWVTYRRSPFPEE